VISGVVDQAIQMIAGWGLPGREGPGSMDLDDGEWASLLGRIGVERVSGLAVEAAAAGGLRLTDEQAGQLFGVHQHWMTWCLRVEKKLLALDDVFREAELSYAVLKGPSIAHTMYEEPCLRPFGDLDLLVRSRDYERACALLERTGHTRRRPEPREHFEVRFGKGSLHKHPDDGIEVDLHRTLVLGPFGLWMEPERLLDRAVPFSLGGRQLLRLDDAGMFVNVAVHAALGWEVPRLSPLRDMAELARRGEIDERVLEDWAERWHIGAVLRHAAHELERKLHVDISGRLGPVEHWPISSRERRLLRAYSSRRRTSGTAFATLAAIPSVHAKTAYIWALTVPSRDFLRARASSRSGGSYLRRWRFGWRTAADRAGLNLDRSRGGCP
jgi:hypothetical protein